MKSFFLFVLGFLSDPYLTRRTYICQITEAVSKLPDGINLENEDLTPEQLQELKETIRKNADVFAKNLKQPGIANVPPHRIPVSKGSPILVKKKDGSSRFCVDYRPLNARTIKDVYPLPQMDEIIDQLADAKIFSVLDPASGYWQIPVAEEDCAKTAFVTCKGLFEFR